MTFTENNIYSGFTLKVKKYLEEISSEVFLFEHNVLQCPLVAIKNNDPNKTFTAAFNTIPTDSTGVAHILEHSVLMGSEKYPVKDVFGEINKGGLTTFLNAMTGSDITYYPFATRNLKEYFNIMDVYCDVVFNPLLAPSTFEQEGWHYHQEEENGPLQFQGVVYNEMKGAFSDPIRYLFHHIFAGLMPGSTYAHESGGDPRNIPDLSYQQFCEFHKKHYHPSNGMFFVYGDAPLEDELEFLQSSFFANYDSKGRRAEISQGTLAQKPVFITERYAVESDDLTEKTFLAVGTNISTVADREKNTAFQIIANILFNSDGSPLKNSIVSSGLCKDFGGLYLATSSCRTVMLTYLVGSEEDHRDEFLALYKKALAEMVEDGLDKDLVLAELNKYEFNFREEASKAQRGLDLISKAMTGLKYGIDPYACLSNEKLIQNIRQKALNKHYFEELIKTYLLDNPSTVTVTLIPDPEKQKKTQQEEQERLDAYGATTTPEEKKSRIERTRELMEAQLKPNDAKTLELLPQLSLADLSSTLDFHKTIPTEMFGREVLVNELETNRISYIDIGFDLSGVPQDKLCLIDTFATIVTEIGTKRLGYQQFAKEIATCTGAFSHSLANYTRQAGSAQPVLWFHLKCLPSYMEQALQLLGEVFSSVSFDDTNRIREIVGREFAWAEHSVHSEGYNLPASRLLAHLSDSGRYNELTSGVSAYFAVKNLARNYDAQEASFLAALRELSTLIFNRDNLLLSVTAGQKELSAFQKLGNILVESMGQNTFNPIGLNALQLPRHEAFISAAEVVFAVQGGNLFKNGEGYNGHFEVLRTYLSRDYLWNTVRQMGGAYGCFIQFGPRNGNLAYISYRDPQVKKTYEAYDKIPGIIKSLDIPQKVMEQLIIGTYGSFNPHLSAPNKGAVARNDYFNGITLEFKRQRVEEIISTTQEKLRSFQDAFDTMAADSYRKIIGNRAKIEADAALFDSVVEL